MTQDRRITDKLPNEELVFTDRNLTAAALAHLEAERAAACLVHAGDDVWVGVGTKPALRSLLSEDTACQSQAVPSELASLKVAYYFKEVHKGWPEFNTIDEFSNAQTGGEALVKLSDVQSLFSHSAATGKVPEDVLRTALNKIIEMNRDTAEHQYGDADKAESWACVRVAREALASPAAPLAGKAEQDAADIDRFWNKAIDAEAEASRLREENSALRAALKKITETPFQCIAIADAALVVEN